MKKLLILSLVLAIALAGWFLFLKEPVFNTSNGFLVNLDNKGIIIDGYDVVSYFNSAQPVKGEKIYSTTYEGAIYLFATEENKRLFLQTPQKFAPQYGAFCGYAVSIGKLRPVDPTIYQIRDGRLILQHTREAFDLFNKDLAASVAKADTNWQVIVAKHAGHPVQYDKPGDAAVTKP
jgi:YHS domain-containing protein